MCQLNSTSITGAQETFKVIVTTSEHTKLELFYSIPARHLQHKEFVKNQRNAQV